MFKVSLQGQKGVAEGLGETYLNYFLFEATEQTTYNK